MKKDFLKLMVLILILAAILVPIIGAWSYASADGYYVLCRPNGEVNVRKKAKLKSEITGVVFFGDYIEGDKEKNGFVHTNDIPSEYGEGWIYKGLLVADKPYETSGTVQVCSEGRVACRKYIGGKIVKWLNAGDIVEIYAISDVWCVTQYGYVQTKYLSVNSVVNKEG